MTDEQFINSPTEWPRWPALPLIKLNAEPSQIRCGILLSDTTPPYKVYTGANIFGLHRLPGRTWGEKLKDVPVAEYPSVQALLAEWRID